MASAFEEVLAVRGGAAPAADEMVINGADPVLSTRFRIGETAAAVLGGIGVAVNDIWEMKTGERQSGSVDVPHAAAALRSTAARSCALSLHGNASSTARAMVCSSAFCTCATVLRWVGETTGSDGPVGGRTVIGLASGMG